MNSTQLEAVRRVVGEAARSQDLVLEDVTVTPAGRRRVLRVVVDLPEEATGGVSLDVVALVSTAVSAALDSSDVMGAQPYVLEVSSPGTDRPLTERRHWMRARGRLVSADLRDGSRREGRIEAVDDDGVTLEGAAPLAWDLLAKGRVEVEFSRPGAEEDVHEEDEETEGTEAG